MADAAPAARGVRLDLFDEDQASSMPTYPHSGFHVHIAVQVPEDDRASRPRTSPGPHP